VLIIKKGGASPGAFVFFSMPNESAPPKGFSLIGDVKISIKLNSFLHLQIAN
jgi:hypothetical protein